VGASARPRKARALATPYDEDEGVGEFVCYAHLVCLDCGRMLDDEGHDVTCVTTRTTIDT